MDVQFDFDDEDKQISLADLAEILKAVQQLWLYVLVLSQEDAHDLHDLVHLLLTEPEDPLKPLSANEGIIEFGEDRSHHYDVWTLYFRQLQYSSPLQIQSETRPPTFTEPGRLRRVLAAIERLLTIDLIREKARWSTELQRQHAIEAALKNTERVLAIGNKIKNPAEREQFIRNMAKAIDPLTQAHPKLKSIELAEPRTDDEAVSPKT